MWVSIIDNLKKINEYAFKGGGCGHGQIFDKASYVGNLRGITFFILVILVGVNIDDIVRWIDTQHHPSPGQEAWHRVVALCMGAVGVMSGLINIYNVYIKRNKSDKRRGQVMQSSVRSISSHQASPSTSKDDGLPD